VIHEAATERPKPLLVRQVGRRPISAFRLDVVVPGCEIPLDVVFWGLDCRSTAGVHSVGRTGHHRGPQTAETDRWRSTESAKDRTRIGLRPGASQLSRADGRNKPIQTHEPGFAAGRRAQPAWPGQSTPRTGAPAHPFWQGSQNAAPSSRRHQPTQRPNRATGTRERYRK
jgi:hypothetical protein